jgi:plasmid stabilization system protein ParE
MAQVGDAVLYVRDELCMPQAAARLLDEIEGAVKGLSSMPNRFHAVGVEQLLSSGVRRMNVRGYSIFYRVDEASSTVDVFAVLYGTPSDARLRRAFQSGMGSER